MTPVTVSVSFNESVSSQAFDLNAEGDESVTGERVWSGIHVRRGEGWTDRRKSLQSSKLDAKPTPGSPANLRFVGVGAKWVRVEEEERRSERAFGDSRMRDLAESVTTRTQAQENGYPKSKREQPASTQHQKVESGLFLLLDTG